MMIAGPTGPHVRADSPRWAKWRMISPPGTPIKKLRGDDRRQFGDRKWRTVPRRNTSSRTG